MDSLSSGEARDRPPRRTSMQGLRCMPCRDSRTPVARGDPSSTAACWPRIPLADAAPGRAGRPRRRKRQASQMARTCSACGPFWPCVTSNSTRWSSSRLRKPLAAMFGVVDEDVGAAAVGGDEAEALLAVEPLHGALSHGISLRTELARAHCAPLGAARARHRTDEARETEYARCQTSAGVVTYEETAQQPPATLPRCARAATLVDRPAVDRRWRRRTAGRCAARRRRRR